MPPSKPPSDDNDSRDLLSTSAASGAEDPVETTADSDREPTRARRRRGFRARYINPQPGRGAAEGPREPAPWRLDLDDITAERETRERAGRPSPSDRPQAEERRPAKPGRLRAGLTPSQAEDPFQTEVDAEIDRQFAQRGATRDDAPAPSPSPRRRLTPPSASRAKSAPLTRLEPVRPHTREAGSDGAGRRAASRPDSATAGLARSQARNPIAAERDLETSDPSARSAGRSAAGGRAADQMRWEMTTPAARGADGFADERYFDDDAPFGTRTDEALAALEAASLARDAAAARSGFSARPAAIAGVAFAGVFAALASLGALQTDLSEPFGPVAAITGLAPSEAGRGDDLPIDAASSPIGQPTTARLEETYRPSSAGQPASFSGRPAGRPAPETAQEPIGGAAGAPTDIATADGETARIETASIGGYLNSETLAGLIGRTPVKCVLPPPQRGGYGPASLDAILQSGQILCAETVDYRSEGALFTHRSHIDGEAILEINAPFAVKGDAICHQTTGLSALVIGDSVPLAEAVSLERVVKANYAATPGGEICYRLRPAFSRDGLMAFEADVFVDGQMSRERTDPRPFLMRGRS